MVKTLYRSCDIYYLKSEILLKLVYVRRYTFVHRYVIYIYIYIYVYIYIYNIYKYACSYKLYSKIII